ncbi:MAG TPA: gamma-glutamylcyclotransferase [Leeuwenhoekiella sp.]|nr:gamma-glutamylcyclotransferase [Leeuwenhoekiella sp.]HAX14033.1 gamma-glutamylcyclotransferase [Leeuwenhoekiella sp.]HBO28149.1 gamma-glutamylcyclotransferase [Leeuwenhoekiella sp.]HCQ77435.1 gamma-glutamylcyclotransferase [Leeuwenhoekiella sp.]|tara:strand:- start:1238 stop:1585 length:348 start_codon:yes stop_codon:yes gene_type:complete
METDSPNQIAVFSYGTLQDPEVQKELYNRVLEGQPDRISGYVLESINLPDSSFNYISYSIAKLTGNPQDSIEGFVFYLSEHELKITDTYESEAYERFKIKLDSGIEAIMYQTPIR